MKTRTTGRRAPPAKSAAVLRAYPAPVRSRLAALRKLILDTARTIDGVGAIEETVKWGQPSFVTPKTRSGTTIRIDAVKSDPKRYALYVHCQTNLVASFRQLYPKEFEYEGNRAILFDADKAVAEKPLRHCIALALTYHARKA